MLLRARAAPALSGFPSQKSTISQLAILSCSALLAGACVLYVFSFWVDVPYYDEWEFLITVQGWMEGRLGWLDLLATQAGHHVFLDRALSVFSAEYFDYDIRLHMSLGLISLAVLFIILLIRYWSSLSSLDVAICVLWIVIASLVFTLRQWEIMLGPWAPNIPLVTTFFLLTLLLLDRGGIPTFALAAVCAGLSALIFTNGLLAWPIGLAYAFVARGVKWAAFWLLTFLAFAAVYFSDFPGFPSGRDAGPLVVLGRFLATLGSPFSLDRGVISRATPSYPFTLPLLMLIGVLVLMVVAWAVYLVWRRDNLVRHRFPLAIVLFGLGSCALIAIGRSPFGLEQALSPRYVPTASLILIGLFLLYIESDALKDARYFRETVAALGTALVLASVVAMVAEFETGPYRRQYLEAWREIIRNYRIATDAQLANPHYSPDFIRERALFLDTHDLGPFRKEKRQRKRVNKSASPTVIGSRLSRVLDFDLAKRIEARSASRR